MSFLTEIGAFFMGIPAATLAFLKGTAEALAENPQVQALATQEVANVESAALTALTSGSVTTGAQKFLQAQAGVVSALTNAGLPVVMNQVNLAIEGAVANLPPKVATQVTDVASAAEEVVTAKAEAAAATVDPIETPVTTGTTEPAA